MNNHFNPIIGTILYLVYPKTIRINTNILFYITVVHNFLLALFSGYIFINLGQIIYNEGIIIQSGYYFQNTHFDYLIYLFYLSKYYEYIDTFILYLQNKKPITLQKFHHIGAVICWHISYYNKVDAIWMATLFNSFVHTIMYSYYLLSLYKIERIKKYKKYITSLQIFQLASANIISPIVYFPPVETLSNYMCILFFNLYVNILIYLFIQFSYIQYIKPKNN